MKANDLTAMARFLGRLQSAIENAKAMEPSQWWTMYGKHVPMLASLPQQDLSQPTAASA